MIGLVMVAKAKGNTSGKLTLFAYVIAFMGAIMRSY